MAEAVKLVCETCGQANRVPRARLAEGPKCGSCGDPLVTGKVAELDLATHDKVTRGDELPIVVDYWAPWCGPCRMMAPGYEKAAAELEPHMRVAKVNTEAAQSLGARYNIRSIPTLALFVGGREVARQAGAMTNPAQIAQWVRANLPR